MGSPIKCATWNVNSARARLGHITAFLSAHQPDVVCLQELKCTEADFPSGTLMELGFESVVHGQRTYNGVAILSRTRATEVDTGLDDEARVIAGTTLGVRWINVYVPNGRRVGSSKYDYKLRWLAQLEDFLVAQRSRHGEFVLMGDFNVILEDLDTAHPEDWKGTVLCDPATRAQVDRIRQRLALKDILRKYAPGPGVYTWWDYRNRGFQTNDGGTHRPHSDDSRTGGIHDQRLGGCGGTRTRAAFGPRPGICPASP